MISLLLAIIYLAFISLGLPDSLLGSAWPVIYQEIHVPLSWSGIISMIIALGTVVSSLNSDRLTRLLGTGRITAISVAMTAAALFGFSTSHSFAALCLWAIPYGLGAGSVDAALNNYVALHYASRHMSWLHCMWGVGASTGPYIMGWALTSGRGWNAGYRTVGVLQAVLTIILVVSLPLWNKVLRQKEGQEAQSPASPSSPKASETSFEQEVTDTQAEKSAQPVSRPLTLREIVALPGAKAIMLCFFCYSLVEASCSLWASSYLVEAKGIDAATAARYASLFFLGITGGRAINGFLTFRFSDKQMIRMGQVIILAGIACMLLPFGTAVNCIGLVIIGLGCAPIYPCIIHSTPDHFGADKSQALIGVQMASAYIGTSFMPPLFGWIAARTTIALFPVYLLVGLVIMFAMHEKLCKLPSHS